MKSIFYILTLAVSVSVPVAVSAESPPQFILQWNTAANGTGLHQPWGIDADAFGNVYVQEVTGRLMKYSSTGVFQTLGPASYRGVACYGSYVYSVRLQSNASGLIWVDQLDGNLGFTGLFFDLRRLSPSLQSPGGVAVGPQGDLYIADMGRRRIVRYNPDASLWGTWPVPAVPSDIAVDPMGNVFITDIANMRVMKYSGTGVFDFTWGTAGSDTGAFDAPRGIALDPQGNVYVADTNNNRIQKFTGGGVFLCEWGTLGYGPGEFQQPYGVAADNQGNVYVSDTMGERVQKFGALATPAHVTSWGRVKALYR